MANLWVWAFMANFLMLKLPFLDVEALCFPEPIIAGLTTLLIYVTVN
jgi:Na+/glutamate symporter